MESSPRPSSSTRKPARISSAPRTLAVLGRLSMSRKLTHPDCVIEKGNASDRAASWPRSVTPARKEFPRTQPSAPVCTPVQLATSPFPQRQRGGMGDFRSVDNNPDS